MSAEIIYGIDFRAGRPEGSDAASKLIDGLTEALAFTRGDLAAGVAIWQADADGKMHRISPEEFYADTTPSDYVAPPFDCA